MSHSFSLYHPVYHAKNILPPNLQAFYAFDGDRSSYVTLSELKKIVENFIFPLTSSQFDDLVKRIDGVSGNKINYNQFLFKISNKKKRESPVLGRITPANNSLDSIVQKLQDKVGGQISLFFCILVHFLL